QNHLERAHDDRLARAGLAGEDVEPAVELDLEVFDQRVVADVEVTKHDGQRNACSWRSHDEYITWPLLVRSHILHTPAFPRAFSSPSSCAPFSASPCSSSSRAAMRVNLPKSTVRWCKRPRSRRATTAASWRCGAGSCFVRRTGCPPIPPRRRDRWCWRCTMPPLPTRPTSGKRCWKGWFNLPFRTSEPSSLRPMCREDPGSTRRWVWP